MTEPKTLDLSAITRQHLIKLLDEAQHTTLMLLSWAGEFDVQKMKSKSSNVDLSAYYLKWIDIARLAIANMSDPIDDTVKKTLIDDLAVIAIVPIQGMQVAMKAYAKQLNVVIPEFETTKTSKIGDISEFKKIAIAELEKAIELLKGKKS